MRILSLLIGAVWLTGLWAFKAPSDDLHEYKPADKRFQYVGRIDFTNPQLPRFWAAGVYIKAAFKGASCELLINDEMMWGKDHNYISVAVDNLPVQRIKLTQKTNTIKVANNLTDVRHEITICKSTESGIGYLEFVGLRCKQLLAPASLPVRKIEFIGNSIACGTGSDASAFPCNAGQWYDQHNAYMAYGPITARALNAQWHLTAVAGIGLTKSCCQMEVTMPDVLDKVNLRANAIRWDFKKYRPDVVTVCLGQNDGPVDSVKFCPPYVSFIKRLRAYYPSATIICLTSPMADSSLVQVQKNYLRGIVNEVNNAGDKNVYKYYFSKRYHKGCGDHPDLSEHRLIADELIAFIEKTKHWRRNTP